MRDEFKVHVLNDLGMEQARKLAEKFSAFLEDIETIVPAGRDRAIVITKLQECSFFAKRGVACLKEYQKAAHDEGDL